MTTKSIVKFLIPNHKYKWLAYFAIVAMLIIAIPNLWGYFKYQNALQKAKEAGFPFTIEEIIPPEVSPQHNASIDSQRIYTTLETIINASNEFYNHPARSISRDVYFEQQQLSQEQAEHIQDFLLPYDSLFQQIHTALQKPEARLNLDYKNQRLERIVNIEIPIISRQNLFILLSKKFMLTIHEHEYDQAFQLVCDMFRFSNVILKESPYGMNLHLAQIFFRDSFQSLNFLTLHHSLTTKQKEEIKKLLEAFDFQNDLEQYLKIKCLEEQQIYELFINGFVNRNDAFYPDRLSGDENPDFYHIMNQFTFDWFGDNRDWAIFYYRYPFSFLYQANHAELLNSLVNVKKSIHLSTHQGKEVLETASQIPDWAELASEVAIDWAHQANIRDRSIACRELIQLAFAVEDYIINNGQYPKSLEALSFQPNDAIPIDPFSGTPYQYQRTEDGCLIYSYGRNGIDNAGQPTRIIDDKYIEGDIVWRFRNFNQDQTP